MKKRFLGLLTVFCVTVAQGQVERDEREIAMEAAQARLAERQVQLAEAQRAAQAERKSALDKQQSELAEAQRALEEAAREVARLSLSGTGPQLGQIARDFRSTGRKAMLGITLEDTKGGAVIVGVSPGGPAEKAGVKSGDVIRQLNDISLADSNAPTRALIETMSDVSPGDVVIMQVQRAGDDKKIEITTEEFRPKAYSFAYESGDAPRAMDFVFPDDRAVSVFAPGLFGGLQPWARMELVELTPQLGTYFGAEEGILVVRAPEGDKGLELLDGDVILEIGARKPKNTSHAMRILRSFEVGEEMSLKIMRNKRRRTVEFTVPEED